MLIYCLCCNNIYEAEIATTCPNCNATGDDLEFIDDELFDEEWELTEEDIDAMYEDYLYRIGIDNEVALIGAQ